MNESINRNAILAYLDGLNPQSPLEVVKVSGDVKVLAEALIALAERVNAPRQVKLWQEEQEALRDEVKKLTHNLEQARLLDQEHKSLAEQRTLLLAEKDMIQDLSGQKEEILQLKAFVAKYDLLEYRKELDQLRENALEDVSRVKVWMGDILDFFTEMKSDFLSEIQVLLVDLEQNYTQMRATIHDAQNEINLKKIELSKWLESYDGELHETQSTYNDLAAQLNGIKTKLLEIREKHAKNVTAYGVHFAQNKAIWGELGKRHHLDEHLAKLFEEIESKLLEFDQEIKGLVEKVDHLTVF
jgi:DNA repair ATPase RecN